MKKYHNSPCVANEWKAFTIIRNLFVIVDCFVLIKRKKKKKTLKEASGFWLSCGCASVSCFTKLQVASRMSWCLCKPILIARHSAVTNYFLTHYLFCRDCRQLTVYDSKKAFSWSVDASGYCCCLFSFLYQSSLKPLSLLLSTLYFDPWPLYPHHADLIPGGKGEVEGPTRAWTEMQNTNGIKFIQISRLGKRPHCSPLFFTL